MYLRQKDSDMLKVNSWRKIYHGNTDPNKAGVAVLISYRADVRTR